MWSIITEEKTSKNKLINYYNALLTLMIMLTQHKAWHNCHTHVQRSIDVADIMYHLKICIQSVAFSCWNFACSLSLWFLFSIILLTAVCHTCLTHRHIIHTKCIQQCCTSTSQYHSDVPPSKWNPRSCISCPCFQLGNLTNVITAFIFSLNSSKKELQSFQHFCTVKCLRQM